MESVDSVENPLRLPVRKHCVFKVRGMKKLICGILIILMINGCKGQVNQEVEHSVDFDEFILNYNPEMSDIDNETYKSALNIIREQKKYYEANGKFVFSNYWNIGTALGKLNESTELIQKSFNEAILSDKLGMCQYIDVMTGMGNVFEERIPKLYNEFKEQCSTSKSSKPFNIEKYANEKSLDKELIKAISKVQVNDSKYRVNVEIDWSKQNTLDYKNQEIIDSLFGVHKEYIGRKYVGQKYESVMFLVIQHADLAYMEKYFDLIVKAVEEEQLDSNSLKYILDRISTRKNDYQYFGTQSGVKYANKEEIEEIRKKYSIQ